MAEEMNTKWKLKYCTYTNLTNVKNIKKFLSPQIEQQES